MAMGDDQGGSTALSTLRHAWPPLASGPVEITDLIVEAVEAAG